MCNMVTMVTSLPAFVEDPALASAPPKPLSLPLVVSAIAPAAVNPLSLPIFVEEPVKTAKSLKTSPAVRCQPSSEKYLPRADGASLQFQNEAFRLRTQAKISELVLAATCSGTNALLAKKALKYRRVAAVQC
ncbi:hypothetical protein P3T76_014591 [Phytophthora citrophthora]|uniref:Uncharacterized protein n=1 Tax=Phytophthora citrophthora TaxID=4793 RepID=A0AAD9LB60_9STRA|nr:hypothetical protein P3T76_014591 [Phytophthora citrophthora]